MMTDKELREKLTPEQYRIMRERGTETPFSGKYWDNADAGVYACAACETELFDAAQQFDDQSGWPSFRKTINPQNIQLTQRSGGRIDVSCKTCKSHLGSITENNGKKYYRINSLALNFIKTEEEQEEEQENEEKEGRYEMRQQENREENADKRQDDIGANTSPWRLRRVFKNVMLFVAGAVIGSTLVMTYTPPQCEAPKENAATASGTSQLQPLQPPAPQPLPISPQPAGSAPQVPLPRTPPGGTNLPRGGASPATAPGTIQEQQAQPTQNTPPNTAGAP